MAMKGYCYACDLYVLFPRPLRLWDVWCPRCRRPLMRCGDPPPSYYRGDQRYRRVLHPTRKWLRGLLRTDSKRDRIMDRIAMGLMHGTIERREDVDSMITNLKE